MADLNKIVEEIKELTVVEVSDLVKLLEETFGVTAAAVVAGPVAAAEEPKEEKTEFNVVLTAIDAAQKVATIKAVREVTGLGLGESKAMVENVPSVLKESLPTASAKEIVEKFKAIGATVELK